MLHLFLTNKDVGKELFDQQQMRTAQPKISDKNIHDFPIPAIEKKTQQQISDLVAQSFALKAESERLLAVAKQAVEMAIEQDEASALSFIKQQAPP